MQQRSVRVSTFALFALFFGALGAQAGGAAVSGTLGQPDAGTLTGGGYTVQGGFWGAAAASYQLYLPLVRR